jgi:hypothetical protein
MLTKAATKKKEKSESEDVEKAASVPKKRHRLWNHQLRKLPLLQSRKKGLRWRRLLFVTSVNLTSPASDNRDLQGVELYQSGGTISSNLTPRITPSFFRSTPLFRVPLPLLV